MSNVIGNPGETEIGGFFELALPDFGDPFPDSFLKFQSARSALRRALESSRFARVLLPTYICNSVVQAVSDAGLVPEFYRLDDRLAPLISAPLAADAALLCVNYFGLCDDVIAQIRNTVTPSQLIVDNTQALFSASSAAFATIYSPRKFSGLPDGGLLVAENAAIAMPAEQDDGSLVRMTHLLVRMSGTARESYASFLSSGHSLEDTRPLRMSRLTDRLLRSIDMHAMKNRRRNNFERLAAAFDTTNAQRWTLEATAVPMCYPLVVGEDVRAIRKALADDSNIYIAAYWEDARHRIEDGSVEQTMLDKCLALPCDQRYTPADIDRLIACVRRALKGADHSRSSSSTISPIATP
jgi:hypothetical protein